MHITQRETGTWYFQRRIPTVSQPFYDGKKFFKRSLKTKEKSQAKLLARQLSAELDIEFSRHKTLALEDSFKKSPSTSTEFDYYEAQARQKQIEAIGLQAAENAIAFQKQHLSPFGDEALKRMQHDAFNANIDSHIELAEQIINGGLSAYQLAQKRQWKAFEANMSNSQFEQFKTYSPEDQSRLYLEFVKGLRNYQPEVNKSISNPLDCIDLPELDWESTAGLPEQSTQKAQYASKNTLSHCIDKYLEARQLDDINEKTFKRYESRMKLLLEVIGDRPIDTLNRQDALTFKSTLLAMPANINKKKEFKGLSIQDVIALQPEPMSKTTANDTLTDIHSFFEWCVVNEYAAKNSFKDLKVRVKKKDSESRSIFETADLQALFSQDIYQAVKPKHAHYYWLPLLGLYTGARMNELCQLYIDDIKKDSESGIWTITITDQREDQKLKNVSSRRTIPVHSQLIKLGFIDYVSELNHERLFPELKNQRDGYQQAASKWFARYRDKILPQAKAESKTFHSFRHTVANHLKQCGLKKSPVAAILGHGETSETFGRYGKAYVMDVLQPVIEHLEFDIKVTTWKNLADTME
ncbi:site-specific integrase [Vibrio algivorus]|uniref:Recombinase n=1 Tax=Vibrio algivorus TaxID=1667024 RepID=A0ABQ6ERA6_9VIBR|nr:site-specific integrase [Vibrio algivorus]GLT15519.1 recombinase [Vibrio algivorus]